jgi:urea transport system permease protein
MPLLASAKYALLVLLVSLTAILPARAQSVEDLVRQLPDGGFGDRSAVIAQLAATGDTRLVPVLEALGAGELNVVSDTGQVVFVRPAGGNVAIRDALTGEDAGEVASGAVDRIRVNNAVRRAIRTAIGQLTLLSPDANTRMSAARAMFQAADPDNLPLLEEALAEEENPTVLRVMQQAWAVATLRTDASATDHAEAIDIIVARGDRHALGILNAALVNATDEARFDHYFTSQLADNQARAGAGPSTRPTSET